MFIPTLPPVLICSFELGLRQVVHTIEPYDGDDVISNDLRTTMVSEAAQWLQDVALVDVVDVS